MLLIDFFNNSKTTENRHFFKAIFRRKQDIKQDIINASKGFALDRIETEIPDLKGARYYTFKG